MRKLAIVAALLFSAHVALAMDARPIAANLPPRIGVMPGFIGPIALPELDWRIHVRVILDDTVKESYVYALYQDFPNEAGCKMFMDTDPGFKQALADLIARAKDTYGAAVLIKVTCED